MAIDDPVGIEIQHAREDIEAQSYLPTLLTRLGLSGVAAMAMAKLPFFSQIVTTLLTSSSTRFEKRFFRVAEALEEQQRNIASKIPDKHYYESEEFQTLLILVLEKLHSTHQDEKLKTFGEALANSGTSEFVKEDKEQYIRTLQELSLEDVQTLRKLEELNNLPSYIRQTGIPKRENPSLSRLASLGLIHESVKLRDFDLRIPRVPTSRQSPEGYAQGIADAFRRYFQEAPLVTYRLSGFGRRFLDFIATSSPPAKTAE